MVSWPLKDKSLAVSRNQLERDVLSLLQWVTLGSGRFLSNGIPLLAFVRTQAKFLQPDVQYAALPIADLGVFAVSLCVVWLSVVVAVVVSYQSSSQTSSRRHSSARWPSGLDLRCL